MAVHCVFTWPANMSLLARYAFKLHNRLILNSLAIPTFKLVVFGQSDAITKLIEMDDSRIIVINSEDKIHYFKNFVEKAMPDVQADIKEQMDLPMVSELIKVFEGAKNE